MELDVQRFLQNPEQQQFEFQHFPTSYLRLAAHRVANHYGLATAVLDSGTDGNENIILVMKTTESRFPAVRLSEIPVAKPSDNGKFGQMKVSIKTRPSKGSGYDAGELEKKLGPLRSVEDRKEEYERARERIFSGLTDLNSDDSSLSRDGNQVSKNPFVEVEKNLSPRERGPTSRVAIFRDSEKDRFDPDYDRSYKRYVLVCWQNYYYTSKEQWSASYMMVDDNFVCECRYIRSLPVNQNFNLPPFNIQQMQTPYYQMGFTGYNQIPSTPASLGFGPSSSSIMSPYGTTVLNQAWPNAAMMYAHPYEQFRNASLKVNNI